MEQENRDAKRAERRAAAARKLAASSRRRSDPEKQYKHNRKPAGISRPRSSYDERMRRGSLSRALPVSERLRHMSDDSLDFPEGGPRRIRQSFRPPDDDFVRRSTDERMMQRRESPFDDFSRTRGFENRRRNGLPPYPMRSDDRFDRGDERRSYSAVSSSGRRIPNLLNMPPLPPPPPSLQSFSALLRDQHRLGGGYRRPGIPRRRSRERLFVHPAGSWDRRRPGRFY